MTKRLVKMAQQQLGSTNQK
ncbi:hypothetical protein [Turicibacter sanguinis]